MIFGKKKDLVEPSKRLAEIVNKVTKEEESDHDQEQNESEKDKIDT